MLIVFTIFKNSIKNRFKDKHLTITYNLIALNIEDSFHMCSTEDDIHEEIHIILSVTSIRIIRSLQWGVKLS